MRLLILSFCFFYLHNISAQLECSECLRYFRFIPTSTFPNNKQSFDIRYQLLFQKDNTIVRDLDTVGVVQRIERSIDSKSDLVQLTSCLHSFNSLASTLSGKMFDYTLTENLGPLDNLFTLFVIKDCSEPKYFILNGDGLHEFKPCSRIKRSNATTMVKTPLVFIEENILYLSDTASFYTLEDDVVFETVTEQVLKKEAYDTLQVSKAILDTLVISYFYKDSVTCGTAEYDTTSIVFKISESMRSHEVVSPVFEVVSELLYERSGFPGVDFYIQDSLLVDTLNILSVDYGLKIPSIQEACFSSVFTPCLNFAIDTIVLQDTNIHRVIYPPCASDFEQKGRFCLTVGAEVNPQYTTHQYEKLRTPSQLIVTEIPAAFQTFTTLTLRNKESIPDSCIIPINKSYSLSALSVPATFTSSTIPATYMTRSYERYVSGGRTLVRNSSKEDQYIHIKRQEGGQWEEQPINTNILQKLMSCDLDHMQAYLIKHQYLSEANKSNPQKVLLSLARFQFENGFLIGVIDDTVLEFFNINR